MKNNYFDQIDKYLNKELSAAEKKAFETELNQNAELQSEMSIHNTAQNTLERLVEQDLRNTFADWSEDDTTSGQQPQAKIRPLVYRLSIAAGLLLLISIGISQFQIPDYSNEQLRRAYYHPLEFQVTRSAPPSTKTDFGKAKAAVLQGDLDYAIQFYSSVPDSSAQYLEAQYLLAHTYYQNEAYDQAAPIFEKVIQANNQRFTEKASWYSLLNRIELGQTDQAFFAELDQMVADENHSYHNLAVELKKKLNSFWRKFSK